MLFNISRYILHNKNCITNFHTSSYFLTNSLKSPIKKITLPNTPVYEYVLRMFNKWEHRIALECAVTGRKYTYEQVRAKSNALANFLYRCKSVKQGDTVAIILPNVPEYPIVLFGAGQAGLKVTMLNPDFTPHEMARQLQDSGTKLVFTLTELLSKTDRAIRALPTDSVVETIAINHEENQIPLWSKAIKFDEIVKKEGTLSFTLSKSMDDVILLPYSSGTTGLPKGVELTNKTVMAAWAQIRTHLEYLYNENDVFLCILPIFHIFGAIPGMMHMISYGMKIVTVPKFEPGLFVNILDNHRPTALHLVPPLILMMTNHSDVKPEHITRMKITTGGAPLTEIEIQKFYEKANKEIALIQGYGLTETSSIVSCQAANLAKGIKHGSSGFCMCNTEVKIVSLEDPMKALGPNQKGEIVILGPQVMKGYLHHDEATKTAIDSEGWFKSGDIGYYDEDGHLFVTDRLKELIKVKGFQVAPAELESYLKIYPGIEDVAVVGIPHSEFGEVPKAFIVPKKGVTVDRTQIQEYIATKLSKHKHLLGGVAIVSNIPKTASGKILRKELQNM